MFEINRSCHPKVDETQPQHAHASSSEDMVVLSNKRNSKRVRRSRLDVIMTVALIVGKSIYITHIFTSHTCEYINSDGLALAQPTQVLRVRGLY
jgi:hypothetical protein